MSLILGACFFTNHETNEGPLPSESTASASDTSELGASETDETPAESGTKETEPVPAESSASPAEPGTAPAESRTEPPDHTDSEPAPYKPLPVNSGGKTYENPNLVRFTNFSVLIPDVPEITYIRIYNNGFFIEGNHAEKAIEIFWTADASAVGPEVVRLASDGNSAVCLRLGDYAEQWFLETGYKADEMVSWFLDHIWIEPEDKGRPTELFIFAKRLMKSYTNVQITFRENGQERSYGWFTRADGSERPRAVMAMINQIPIPGFYYRYRAYLGEGISEAPRSERSLTIESNGAAFTAYENSRLISFRENESAPVQYYWAEVGGTTEFRKTGIGALAGDYGVVDVFGLFKQAADYIEYDELFYAAGIVTVEDRGQSDEELIREFEKLLNERIRHNQLSPDNHLFVSSQEQTVEAVDDHPREHDQPLEVKVVLRFSVTHFDIAHAGQYMSLEEMGRLERREGVYGTYAIPLSGVITLEKGVYVLKMRVDTGDGGLGESLGHFGLEYLPRAEE